MAAFSHLQSVRFHGHIPQALSAMSAAVSIRNCILRESAFGWRSALRLRSGQAFQRCDKLAMRERL
jgi:hypothetical protein